MSHPRITTFEQSFATGYCDDLFIGLWSGAVTLEATAEWSRQYDNMAARHPTGFLVLVVIEEHTPIPDATCRKALAAVMDGLGSKVRAMSAVQEASGFLGSAVRSVLLALTNMTRGAFPRRVFGSCDEAARWLASQVDPRHASERAAAIVAAVVELRALVKTGREAASRDLRAAS
jgi:hypothetical protein